MAILLEVKGVSKAFPGVQALDNVDFDVYAGEVLALAGANGAGKSTLLKIITGVYERDSGEIFVNGKPERFRNPADGKRAGIATIYQELTVIPNLTVAENLFITEIIKKNLVNYKELNERADKLLRDLNLSFKGKTVASSLTVANQQMVEIARAISEKAQILIMDEPTSALSDKEKNELFGIVRNLKAQGMGIIFVTHRIKEIFEIADRASVMRDGKMIGTYPISELDQKKIVELMTSQSMSTFFPKQYGKIGETVFEVKHLKSGKMVKDVSFNLRKGEILGLTGLLGAGRTETARCIFGLDPNEGGEILLRGESVHFKTPRKATSYRIALVPENRKEQGLVLKMNIAQNIILGSKVIQAFRSKKNELTVSRSYIDKLMIKCTGPEKVVEELSGGNQQKVVVAKWLLRNADILILDEPTRGIDVAAKAEIHKLISDLAVKGTSIIMISSELEEIMGMCDRAVVLYEGSVVGELERSDFTESAMMRMSHGYAAAEIPEPANDELGWNPDALSGTMNGEKRQ